MENVAKGGAGGDQDPHWKYVFRQSVQEIWYWQNLMMYQKEEPPDTGVVTTGILKKTFELLSIFR